MLTLDVTKPVRTRDGLSAEYIGPNKSSYTGYKYPHLFRIETTPDNFATLSFTPSGRLIADLENPCDLFNLEEELEDNNDRFEQMTDESLAQTCRDLYEDLVAVIRELQSRDWTLFYHRPNFTVGTPIATALEGEYRLSFEKTEKKVM